MAYHKNLRGNDLHAPSSELVENNTGYPINGLQVVTLDGMGTCFPQIKVNNSMDDIPFGIAQTSIVTGKSGYVTCLGFLFEVNTSSWPVGTILYSDMSGNLTTSAQGGEVAEVIKQDATYGILYVLALGSYISDTVGTAYWATNGNAELEPSNFLGTTDLVPLNIRTNNQQVGMFDTNGRMAIGAHQPQSPLHIKSYPGYSGSGLRTDTFALTSDTINSVPIYAVTMADGQVARVKFQVTARQNDGSKRGSWTRSMLIYKQNGNVLVEGAGWTSDFTIKSDNEFDIGYTTGVTDLTFTVQNAVATATYWVGHVEMEFLGGPT